MFGMFCNKKIGADELVMKLIHNGGPGSKEVIFCHGVNSSAEKAFTNTAGVLWITDLLLQEFESVAVSIWIYTYRNDLFLFNANPSEYSLQEQAQVLLNEIFVRKAATESFVLVGHSFGGLLIKQLLLLLAKRDAELLSRLKGVVFYGTPHRGAIPWWVQRLCGLLCCATHSFRLLEKNHPSLKQLHRDFMQLKLKHNFAAFSFYEDDKKWGLLLVPKWSAVHDLDDDKTNMRAVGRNHTNMCKPYSTENSTFIKFVTLVSEMLEIDSLVEGEAELETSPLLSKASSTHAFSGMIDEVFEFNTTEPIDTSRSTKISVRRPTDSSMNVSYNSTPEGLKFIMEVLDPTVGVSAGRYESPAASRANAETPAAVYTPTDQRAFSKTPSTVRIGDKGDGSAFSNKNLEGAFEGVSTPRSATNTKTGELSDSVDGESKSSERTELDDTDALSVG